MTQTKTVVNYAALRLAASEDLATFMKFSREFNTYEIRSSKGQPSDKAANAALDQLRNLEASTGENIILIPVNGLEDKELVLDVIYNETIKATRFTK